MESCKHRVDLRKIHQAAGQKHADFWPGMIPVAFTINIEYYYIKGSYHCKLQRAGKVKTGTCWSLKEKQKLKETLNNK